MNPKAEEKLRRLTKNQAKVLKTMIFPPNFPKDLSVNATISGSYISNASGYSGNMLGGTVSSLERNDLIQPFGKEGRKFNWQVTDLDLLKAKEEDPKTLQEWLEQLSGEK